MKWVTQTVLQAAKFHLPTEREQHKEHKMPISCLPSN